MDANSETDLHTGMPTTATDKDGNPLPMTIAEIASVCHEAIRAYCQTQNDDSQPTWEDAPNSQRTSAIKGVEFVLLNLLATPEDQHKQWLAEKQATGWRYGAEKNTDKKTHPCFLPYDQLPIFQQRKDHLFRAVVLALKG